MQKLIRILAIVATALAVLSLVLLVITMPLQSLIARFIYHTPVNILSVLPLFPTVPFLITLLRAVCFGLLIICCGNKKGGIWLELVIVAALAFGTPFVTVFATALYHVLMAQCGDHVLVAYNIVTNITGMCTNPADWGLVLAYVVCGMSMMFKYMSKKAKKTALPERQESEI